ncbi:choloylglycine hydrolase [Desulfonispora thiosulfatigenes DSM 11270]|uniref:Choloylglycine hydrolase n=1 Tax=Desulfonispora thiosulfatigenes DSM 11270 TaxID=656914 RepID=A0A1W1VAG5_DESTI|nr:choloylglycine hydrolase family protein [Desulfonispora thiosulfatigenes]SMB90203.1 choloylglycine hydrolase [Desulfonispora thiosulfatigenes DSM 11270]
MCTSITLQTQQRETFFGRTMDFSYDIQPEIYIIPNDYIWNNSLNMRQQFRDYYSFIGIGQELDGILAFFDGVNEKGFAAAALYFPGYVQYDVNLSYPTSVPVASFDFLHYILGRCSSINDLKKVLNNISIVGMTDPVTNTVAPLHWIVTDKSGKCVVIELTDRGLELFDNPLGVMTNSPDFKWHMTNLRNYMETSPEQTEEAIWENIRLTPFGQGGGSAALPGGYTSPERFVRTAYLKTHLPTPKNRAEAIMSCFHVMESVSIPRGAVLSSRGTYDYTKYTAFLNTNTCEYFFTTYDNMQIKTASLFNNQNPAKELTSLGKLNRPILFEEIIKG